jgi:hypothetical protein
MEGGGSGAGGPGRNGGEADTCAEGKQDQREGGRGDTACDDRTPVDRGLCRVPTVSPRLRGTAQPARVWNGGIFSQN